MVFINTCWFVCWCCIQIWLTCLWCISFYKTLEYNLSTCVRAGSGWTTAGNILYIPISFSFLFGGSFLPFFFFKWVSSLYSFLGFMCPFSCYDLSGYMLPGQLFAHPPIENLFEWVCMGVSIVTWAASKGSVDSVGRNGSVGSEKTDRIKSFEKQFRFIQN